MITAVRLILTLILAAGLVSTSLVARDRATIGTGGPQGFFGGAGGGGIPHPPTAAGPPPSFIAPQGGGPVLLSVQSSQRRLVVIRSAGGELLAMRVLGPREVVAMTVPAAGALLDVIGTDAVGVPVLPGQALTVVAP